MGTAGGQPTVGTAKILPRLRETGITSEFDSMASRMDIDMYKKESEFVGVSKLYGSIG